MDPDESKDTNGTENTKSTSTNPFKIEWSLFWDGLLGDHEKVLNVEPLRVLSKEQVHQLIKDLSSQRKQLHKQIESVNKEIELNSVKLESLKLVGSESAETISRINQLSDTGQELGLELQKLNHKLKLARTREKEISNKDWA